MKIRILFVVLFFLILSHSCTTQRITSPTINIIFDTDMGSDCDDVGALALLMRRRRDRPRMHEARLDRCHP